MVQMRAACPGCGAVELAPDAIDFQWCSYAPASYYRFSCPSCGEEVRKPADASAAQLLISGGVRPKLWHLPLEALEAHEGPALTYDDLLDFHELLSGDEWFEGVEAMQAAIFGS